jgi:tripartite-type tricarboxylate transporter receptor subunit TctC
MMMMLKFKWWSVLLLICLMSSSVFAAKYPEKAVQVNVAFSPGGSTDIWARAFCDGLQKKLGQPFTVLNIPGAGGALGLAQAYNEKPDGYTLVTTGSYVTSNSLQKKVPFGLFDITHIAVVNIEPFVLVVKKEAPWKNLAEFINDAKQHPNKYVFNNAGAGGLNHLAAAAFISATKISARNIPFNGGSNQLNAILGGNSDIGFFSQTEVLTHINAGTLRALAVATNKRSAKLADVPTLAELKIKGVPQGSWRGLGGPKGMPTAIVKRLEKAVAEVVKDEKYIGVSERFGFITILKTGGAMKKFLKEDLQITGTVLKNSGLIK